MAPMPSLITRPALDELADHFTRHIDGLPVSAHTARSYTSNVRRFSEWLAEQEHHAYEDVVTESLSATKAVRAYRQHLLVDLKQKPKTVDTALTAISAMYSWLEMDRPAVKLAAGRGTRDDPPALTEEQARDVLSAAEARGPRDHAVVMLFYAAGPRVAEAAALDMDDLALAERVGEVEVRYGKGGKPRTIPLNGQAVKVLNLWKRERTNRYGLDPRKGPLFVGPGGKRLSDRSLRGIVAKTGKAAGLLIGPHTLRHTCLEGMARKGVDLSMLQDISGHASADSLRPYIRSRKRDRHAAVELLTIDY